ncbi:MAG: fluoride efflux transporter CrcB [Lactobacillus sp.]|jgi:CrcB protein|nr:fluoride efflux transporter CrcB [Lactobacillus sp.]MCH3906266.1 fluoride efflux transporter CrcB [Lactobacillus sp.]MCH3990158.1 fluoride efflux transporter CrcB [Lactobacillus sp.]MCH4069128.1 fluoride efflux transporter CrcB [Lactobacillus sp.]MCI1303885.1 fluoride efflux transporter CrcB [Lactobacillus sp.]
MNILLAGIGAAIGAMLRYSLTNYGKRHWEWIGKIFLNLPIPTLVINLTGAFILGLIFSMQVSVFWYALIGTGVLGGYTTFSTLNTELVGLYHSKNYRGFVLYSIASFIGGLFCIYLGYGIGVFFR